MDRKEFRTALCEALQVSVDKQLSDCVEPLLEAVGKASFGNYLDSKDITKIGKALKKLGFSLDKLEFKKVAPKTYKFSKARKRFLNKVSTIEYPHQVVVFINPNTKEYLASLIMDKVNSEFTFAYDQGLLASNLDIEPKYDRFGIQMKFSILNETDLGKIMAFVNNKDTIPFVALVDANNHLDVDELVNKRKKRQIVNDKMTEKIQRVRMMANPHFKKLKKMFAEIGYSLSYFYAVKEGTHYEAFFRLGDKRPTFGVFEKCNIGMVTKRYYYKDNEKVLGACALYCYGYNTSDVYIPTLKADELKKLIDGLTLNDNFFVLTTLLFDEDVDKETITERVELLKKVQKILEYADSLTIKDILVNEEE